ncbi:hypothetical protein CROQUDRAFT_48821 [Cronartium quercuum f. sp. fusiforme G11]|uniref:Uncharacterized protein n=1 Tax=Cronartium quercuum f. sp. fusiforme G11 TaxID=708437 RepID=A0A9P6NC70_9BASI|nr:hypothetical protein CROQUDRAFT_48821 [Cronartium quercuum f. sp. fusiforme G11]
MNLFRSTLTEVVLPTAVGCIPSQLGMAKCGKLKASQWYVLFVYVIPLIVGDIFLSDIETINHTSNRGLIMDNIACLVQCTHIVNSRNLRPIHAKRFEDSYRKYNKTSKKIFADLSINPNHHYVLHIPEQLKLWGPLGEVAEFTGKRMIAKLCREMEETVLKRLVQMQRLEAETGFSDLIKDTNNSSKTKPKGRTVLVDNSMYNSVLAYVQDSMPDVHHHRRVPNPTHAYILQPDMLIRASCLCQQKIRVAVTAPNDCVCFKLQGKIGYGFIQDILTVTIPGREKLDLLRVEKVENMFCKDSKRGSQVFCYWLYQMKTVIGKIVPGELEIVLTSAVKSVAAYRQMPKGMYGLESGGVMIIPVNHLSVLEINLETMQPQTSVN